MNQVFINKSGIIEIHVVGDQTIESVEKMALQTMDLANLLASQKQPVFVIDNLKTMGETTPEARAIVAKYVKEISFRRAAMVGDTSRMMRFGTNLMLRAIGKSNVRFFSSLESAQTWFEMDREFEKLKAAKL